DGEAFVGQNEVWSEDPFNIYDLLNKKKEDNKNGSSAADSLKYPLGFTPREDVEAGVEHLIRVMDQYERVVRVFRVLMRKTKFLKQ
ncbi:hypothetical protein Tco_0166840, partial [Tanacetum coccineum]